MSIRSWLIFCVFVLIMGVIGLTLGIIDGREERRKEDEKDELTPEEPNTCEPDDGKKCNSN